MAKLTVFRSFKYPAGSLASQNKSVFWAQKQIKYDLHYTYALVAKDPAKKLETGSGAGMYRNHQCQSSVVPMFSHEEPSLT